MTHPLATNDALSVAGAVLGDYRIHRLLGRGGMGAVYEAERVPDGRRVALKVLSIEFDTPEARKRFLREGRSAAAVNHPNTVYVYGTEEIDGRPVISMELVADGTLEDRVRARGPLPVDEVIAFASQLIDGLAAAHAAGLLHRDVKPSNCFITVEGTLKIGDFGLSKPVDADAHLRLTQSGVFLGTPIFSSPEQLLGQTLDVRSDIYSVGLTLYFALTGELPFPAGNMMQVAANVMSGTATPLSAYRPDVPPAVTSVVMKAIARKKEDRFQDYVAFRDALAKLRVPTFVAAKPNERLRAWAIDAAVCTTVEFLASELLPTHQRLRGHVDPLETLCILCVTLGLVAMPEVKWGASLGKWLVGLQVVDPSGKPPSLGAAVVRTLVLWAAFVIADLAAWLTNNDTVELVVLALCRILLIMTARAASDWRTIYDRWTGTRVVRQLAEPVSRRPAVINPVLVERPSAPVGSSAGRIGPYTLVDDDSRARPTGSLLGWDEALRRYVWLTKRHLTDPPLEETRRAVARVGRLRWTGSGVGDGFRWDAYEALEGEPFVRRVGPARTVSWFEAQGWILDLADELVAAEQDETSRPGWSLDDLWVTASSRLVIVDVADARAIERPGFITRPTLIGEMVERARRSPGFQTPLPPFATAALDKVIVAAPPRDARSAIAETWNRPVEISRRRRALMIGLPISLAMATPLSMGIGPSRTAAADHNGELAHALIQYIDDSLRLRRPTAADTVADRERWIRERRLASIYLGSMLADRLRDSARRFGLSEKERERGLSLVKEFAAHDTTDIRNARVLVDSIWRGVPPGTRVWAEPWIAPAFLTFGIASVVALCAPLIALLFRRGPVFRAFQIELVDADGRPARRPRVLIRQVVACIPIGLTAYLIWWLTGPLIVPFGDSEPYILPLVLLVVVSVSAGLLVAASVRNPKQSPADRLARTYLVPAS